MYGNQIGYLQKELARQQQLRKKYSALIQVDQQEQQLIDARLATDATLFKKGVLSKMQYNESQRSHHTNSKQLQQNNVALQRIDLEITRLENAIAKYDHTEEEDLLTYQLGIRKALHALRSAIYSWKDVYMISSPIK